MANVIGSFLAAIQDRMRKKKAPPTEPPEERIFDPAVRRQMVLAHSGQLQQKTQGYSGYGAPAEAEDANYAQGGEIPSRFRRAARKMKTSIPSPR